MRETSPSAGCSQPTRRQFGLTVAGAAAGVFAAPAILRGRNLNEKLNIAVIGVGGPGRVQPRRRLLREHRGAVRRVRAGARPRGASPSPRPPAARLPQALRPRPRVRRGGREHHRAYPRLRHAAGLATGQTRLLREAADPQRLGGTADPRGRGEGQGRHPDGHADPRHRQLPPRRRADPVRRDRAGARRPRLGRPGLGPSVEGGGRAESRHRLRDRAAHGSLSRPQGLGLGPLARPRAGAAVPRGLRPRSEMVPMVGLRQRHHERPRQPLERPAVLGAEAQRPADDRGVRAPGPPGDRPSLDARDVSSTGRATTCRR